MKKSKTAAKKPFKTAPSSEMNSAAAERLREASQNESNAVFELLNSSKDGISTEEAKKRILKHGLNEVDYDRAPSWYVQLFQSFVNPFVLILVAIVAISLAIDVWYAQPGEKDWKTVIVVSVMIIISSLLSFFQEYRSNQAAEELKSMVKTTAAVLRKGEEQ